MLSLSQLMANAWRFLSQVLAVTWQNLNQILAETRQVLIIVQLSQLELSEEIIYT